MPARAGRIERPARRRRDKTPIFRRQPGIMAHPDIMIERPAIAQSQRLPQHALGRLVVEIVIARRDAQAMLRHHDIADLEHRARPAAGHAGQLHPGRHARRKHARARIIILRHDRDEHPVDIMRPDRIGLARQQEAAVQRIEVQRDDRIVRIAIRIVPQPHIPGAWASFGVAPFDGQRRAIDRIERLHACRLPAKTQHAARKIPVGRKGKQRMVPAILRFPDQPRQIARSVKHRIDPQRVHADRHHARHHRPGEIHRPEQRREALGDTGVLIAARGGKPMRHGESFDHRSRKDFAQRRRERGEEGEEKDASRHFLRFSAPSAPLRETNVFYSASAPRTARATCRALRASAFGASAPLPLTVIETRTSRPPCPPAPGITCPLLVGMNTSGPRSPTR